MGFFSRLLGREGYRALIDGDKVHVRPLKHMDKYDSVLDRMSAALHTVDTDEGKRYVVSFIDTSGKKRFFDLPERYAKLVLKR